MLQLNQVRDIYVSIYKTDDNFNNFIKNIYYQIFKEEYNENIQLNQFFIFYLLSVLQQHDKTTCLPYDREIFIPVPIMVASKEDVKRDIWQCLNCKNVTGRLITLQPCNCTLCARCILFDTKKCIRCQQTIEQLKCAENEQFFENNTFQCPFKKCNFTGNYEQCIFHCKQCEFKQAELQDNFRASYYMTVIQENIIQKLRDFIALFVAKTKTLNLNEAGEILFGQSSATSSGEIQELRTLLEQKEEMIKQLFQEENDNIQQIELLQKTVQKLKKVIKAMKAAKVEQEVINQETEKNNNKYHSSENNKQQNDATVQHTTGENNIFPQQVADCTNSKQNTRPATTYSLHSQNHSTTHDSVLSQYKTALLDSKNVEANPEGNAVCEDGSKNLLKNDNEQMHMLQMLKQLHRENERLKVQAIQSQREMERLEFLLAGKDKQNLISLQQQKDLSTICDEETDKKSVGRDILLNNSHQISFISEESFISDVYDPQQLYKSVTERITQQSVASNSINIENDNKIASSGILNKPKNRSGSAIDRQSISYISSFYQMDVQSSTPIQVRLFKEIDQLKRMIAQQQELINQKQTIINYKDSQIQELQEQKCQEKQGINENNIQQPLNQESQKSKQIELLNEIIKIKENQYQDQINTNNIIINNLNKKVTQLQERLKELEPNQKQSNEQSPIGKHPHYSSSTIIYSENDPILKKSIVKQPEISIIVKQEEKNKQDIVQNNQQIEDSHAQQQNIISPIYSENNAIQQSKVNKTLVNQVQLENTSLNSIHTVQHQDQGHHTMVQSSLKPKDDDNENISKDIIIKSLQQQCQFLQNEINKHILSPNVNKKKQQLQYEQEKLINQYQQSLETQQKKYEKLTTEIKNYCQYLVAQVFNVNQRYNKHGTDFQGLKTLVQAIINKYNTQIDQQNRQLTQQQKLNDQQVEYWKKYYDKYNQLLVKQKEIQLRDNQYPKSRQMLQSPGQNDKVLKQNKDKIINLQNEVQRLQTFVIQLQEQLSRKNPKQDVNKVSICNIRLTDSNNHYKIQEDETQVQQSIAIQNSLRPKNADVTIDDLKFEGNAQLDNKHQSRQYVSQLDYDISVFNFLRYVFSDKMNKKDGNSLIIQKMKWFLKQSDQYFIYYQFIIEIIRYLICNERQIILNDKLFRELSGQQQAEIKDFIRYLQQQNTNLEDHMIQEYTKSQESYGYQERKLFLKLIEQIRVMNIRKK